MTRSSEHAMGRPTKGHRIIISMSLPTWRVSVLVSVAALLALGPPARADEVRVGAAAVKITPPAGTPMAGYYYARAAEGVHDELYAKAIVIEKDGEQAALVGLDLISTTMSVVREARALIEQATDLRGDHVMISATHAHTGPVLANRLPSRSRGLGGESALAQQYAVELPKRIAESVRLAVAALRPARITAAVGHEASIAFNRRFHMTDGTVGWNPGKLNPKILKPAGPIDPDVPVVFFETSDGSPLATYVNYAVHLDNVGGLEISADLPYTLSKLLGNVLGDEVVTLFTAGTCGDINHIDVTWGKRQKGHANAARMGTILAGEVLRTWRHLTPAGDGPLQVRREIIKVPSAPITPGDVERARAIAARREAGTNPKPTFLEVVDAFKILDVHARDGKPIEVEVQVITLDSDLAWVSLPGEIFVELGLAIKQDSPFGQTMIAELANGSIGYIPSRRAYPQGNYEVVSARCARGSGELLVEAAVRMLKAMHQTARSAVR